MEGFLEEVETKFTIFTYCSLITIQVIQAYLVLLHFTDIVVFTS